MNYQSIFVCDCFVQMIKEIMAAVTIPVMAKARVGHFAEAQVLQVLGVDMVDESEGENLSTCLPGTYLPGPRC